MLHFLILSALQAAPALAIDRAPIAPPTQVGLATGGALGVVCLGLQWLFTGAIIFSIVMALVAAFEYMQGGGSPDKVKQATNRLIYVAIGVAVAILARSVPVIIGSLFGTAASGDTSSICTR